jgi:hypothetical protein
MRVIKPKSVLLRSWRHRKCGTSAEDCDYQQR